MKSVILIAALSVASTFAGILGGPISNPANGHAYYILTPDTWVNSEREAVTLGGHLVTINDAAENDFVYGYFSAFNGQSRSLWVGLTDVALDGDFRWINGEPVSFTKWFAGEPNNVGGAENYGEMFGPADVAGRAGFWNDAPNTFAGTLDNGIVEVIPLQLPKEIWDANAGLTIINTSPLLTSMFDARDVFGGNFGTSDLHDILFSDSQAGNFVHFIEWRTPSPVTLKSIRLFTGSSDPAGREYSAFILKAKPVGGSTFSIICYQHDALRHPFVLLPNGATTEANVVPVTAQDFRAEFWTYPNQTARGPRILELDGFDQYLPINFMPLTIQQAVLLKWGPGSSNDMQVQWSSELHPNAWFDLGPPTRFQDSATDPIVDPKRFYRLLQLE